MNQTPIQGFRLSPQQRRVWLLQQASPQQPFSVQATLQLTGHLDRAALLAALQAVVERHEILRTTFQSMPGMQFPLQVIAETLPPAVDEHDLSMLDAAAQTAAIEALRRSQRQRSVDLAAGPLLHVALIRQSADAHLLLMEMPAVAADPVSLRLLAREIGALYTATIEHTSPPDDPPQYVDLADWQNELVESDETAAGRAFWQQQDLTPLRTLALPFARSADAATWTPATIVLSAERTAQIAAFTQRHNLSAADLLLACWLLLLHRYSAQDELIVALASDGRKYEELTEALGPFATYLPLHSQIDERAPFATFAQQVRAATEAGQSWQEYFAWDYLAAVADTQGVPHWWPFGFAFDEQPATLDGAGLSWSIQQQSANLERFVVLLSCAAHGDELSLRLHYDAACCAADDIADMGRALHALIADVLARPDTALADLALVDTAERGRVLQLVNGQPHAAPAPDCFHLRFAAQAERTPDSIAVLDRGGGLSYRELDRRTNQLAHTLQARGVGPEACVALLVERSIDFVVGLLGVLKAGGAYVPLDPALPVERLQFMLGDLQPPVLLTQQHLLAQFEGIRAPLDLLCLDRDWSVIAESPTTPSSALVGPDNLAYVLFTSGSTGQPKGVAVAHRQLCAYLDAIVERLDLPGPLNFALVSTVAADLGNTALFPALTTGGRLDLISAEQATDPAALAAHLRQHPADCLKITPSHLRALLAGAATNDLLPRKRLILGGEAAPTDWIAELLTLMPPDARVLNHYGPTETTVGVLTLPVDAERMPSSAVLPLGRPLRYAHAYVLNAEMEPLPAWVPGELYIGGATVTRGYLHRPALTAERFVPDPFDAIPGARLYRTGDRARVLPDGTIAFLGRSDRQVKLRGFRIELGEIEATLRQHPAVREAAVMVRADTGSDPQLVAYVVAGEPRTKNQEPDGGEPRTKNQEPEGGNNGTNEQRNQEPGTGEQKNKRTKEQGNKRVDADGSQFLVLGSVQELREFLQQRLPAYMLPSAFVTLDKLPLTANGKLDWHALPAPQPEQGPARVVVAPRSPDEELLADLWRQVLGVAEISRDDSFFALGGHSLLATQMIGRMRSIFGVELPLRALFEAPTLAEVAAELRTLRSADTQVAGPPLERIGRTADVPLSPAQQGLWFIAQLAPDSGAYTMPLPLRISGAVDLDAFRRALNALVQRHEVLRTTFVQGADGQPVQMIAAEQPIDVALHDLETLDPAARAETAARLAAEDAGRPFDLEQGPLLRATVLRLDSAEHVLLLALSHLIGDGWSLRVMIRELGTLYDAARSGTSVALAPLPIHYADYAIWQRAWLHGAVREQVLSYWREQLRGAPPLLQLPTDYSRPEVMTYRGASFSFTFPIEVASAVHELSRRAGVTPFMTLLAAFQVLLARYSGQNDIVVGTPSANRTRAETEGLIGLFLNTLALRSQIHDRPSFNALLQRVRNTTLDAFAHQALPFDQVVEAVQPARDLRYNPLFQVMFMFQNIPNTAVDLPDLTVDLLEVDSGTAMLDLTLALVETAAGLYGVVEYNTDLFADATIQRLVEHYRLLLIRLTAEPERSIAAISLLSADEQHQLAAWNRTAAPFDRERCIHELFEAQAARTPDAVALVADQEHLSYRELNRRADQLAHYLRAQGVGPETLVGVCVERSAEMLIALLAVLKAGGAYVPLDPAYPAERIAFILADARAPLLITQQRLADHLDRIADGTRLICLDADWPEISRSEPLPAVTPENLAYVIYTSGSTGRPKGVAITHRSVVNFLTTMRHEPGLGAHDTLLAVTTISFDIAGLELFLPLSVGARVVVVSRDVAADGARLAAALRSNGATVMQATPATWRLLLDSGWPGDPALTAFCGGEALPRELADQLRPRVAALWNLYGPTETTIWSAIAQVDDAPLTLGHPIANTQLYLLDQHSQPVPIGVAGELYIGGDGLARGYLNRPDLTAERFLPDPFSSVGARMYHTGDLARYRLDGTLEFLGRVDQQIKLRGFRIELGEIETVLAQHPAVHEAAVVVREDRPGDQRLVAYVVAEPRTGALWAKQEPDGGEPRTKNQEPRTGGGEPRTGVLWANQEPGNERTKEQGNNGDDAVGSQFLVLGSVQELREFVQQRLPAYMLPSAFVPLPALPRTPNGKLDRRALPAPEQLSDEQQRFVAPRTPTEELLAGIWASVLGVTQLSIHDDFFALGGHSLLITQVVSRVRDALHVELPLRSVFEHATVAELSKQIEAARQTAHGALLPPLRPVARSGELPLSFAQQRLWFLDQLVPNNAFYNVPAAVRLEGRLDAAVLEQALNRVVARHESLRTTFPALRGQAVQVIAAEQPLTLALVDLRHLAESHAASEVRRHASDEAQRPFDLQQGPLLRAMLLQVGADDHVLLMTMHHIISDGWSMGVLIHELAAAYIELTTGAATLEPLPIQYVDYAVWQRGWMEGDVLSRQLGYWRQQLADLPTLDLPTDRPRPLVQSFRGATQRFEIAPPLTAALRSLSGNEGVTLFMTLLTAFQTLLQRYSGQSDIVVGTPIAGRTRTEVESLIGLFVNTLVLRTRFEQAGSFRAALQRVREVVLDAYMHQDLPFEMLVDELQPQRDMSRNPLFQVLFALQNMPLPAIELPDLRLQSVAADSAAAKFDLWLSFREGPDTLYGSIEYATDLFDAATITRMIGHLQQLLHSIVADPAQQLARLPLVTDAERQQMLVAWNSAYAETPATPEVCLHQLVTAQAARTPDAVALIDGETRLSYAELNRRANQLAHYLRREGVGAETPIGVCLERSAELIVAVLGVLKAGGAYVPLDPAYPPDRLEFMLEDSHAPLLITQQRLLPQLPAERQRTICLDTSAAMLSEQPAANPAEIVTPDNLAYVIYTSGSTGQPKGVAIAHRSPVNLVDWSHLHYTPEQLAGVLFATSICFDLSVWELFVTLSCGGSVIVAENALHLPSLPAARAVTLINTVPSALTELLRVDGLPAGLTTVNLAGEPLPLHLAQQLYRQPTIHQLNNLYGPSETTTYSTWATIAPDSTNAPPIGRPIKATEIYLLDANLEPVPIGAAGELYIGGAGVARGYLNQPALTAERFVPDLFSRHPGTRLYRTGDLARYQADGTLEFLGRADQQVKLRGFRIELGEIESVLHQHAAVHEAVAMAWSDPADERSAKRLVAYVVPRLRDDGSLAQADGEPVAGEHVADWQQVFDTTYQDASAADPTFNIAGWISSFSGDPLPAAEMREWVDHTVTRIRALRPRRVLEIGCGTGLLLFPIAPECERYHGTDFSPAVIERLQQLVATRSLPQVTLEQRAADDLAGLAGEQFDLVIINSVAQYFPSIEYLRRVLEGALDLLVPGGRIFLGDLRSMPLLEAFHTAVELHHAPATLPTTQLRQRVQRRIAQERELAVDPRCFPALLAQMPRLSEVALQLKRGVAHNELTKFRYDVVLTADAERRPPAPIAWLDWQQERLTIAALHERLADNPTRLGLRQVPNARLATEAAAVALLSDPALQPTVADLHAALHTAQHAAIEPEALWALGDALGYNVALGWSGVGSFDALFEPRSAPSPDVAWHLAAALPVLHTADTGPDDWAMYANHPLQARLARQLVPLLRHYVQERLPKYMLPSAFVLLPALPLTPNGKVDRQALPAPLVLPELEVEIVPPRTPVERTLVEVWSEVLGIEQVGIHNNFFALGGDSILSLQVIARAQQAGLHITPKQMFQHQTVAELAAAIADTSVQPAHGPLPLTQGQRWLLAQQRIATSHVVQIDLQPGVAAEHLRAVIGALIEHHDALRLRLSHTADGWQQIVAAPSDVLTRLDLAGCSADQQAAALAETTEALRRLDRTAGPLFQARLLDYGAEQPGHLLLAAAELIMDRRAWTIVLADFATASEQISRGATVALPATSSFGQWVAHETAPRPEPEQPPVVALPQDQRDDAAELTAAAIEEYLSVDETTALLGDAQRAYHTEVEDLLLTALAQTVGGWAATTTLPVDLVRDGRTGQADLARAVGCFTTVRPARLTLPDQPDPAAALRSIKEQIREIEQHAHSAGSPRAELCFTYTEAAPPSASFEPNAATPPYRLALHTEVHDGRLRIEWRYDRATYRHATVTRLAQEYLGALRALIAHCVAAQTGSFTPSDFPKARLNQKDLDKLAARLGKPGNRRP